MCQGFWQSRRGRAKVTDRACTEYGASCELSMHVLVFRKTYPASRDRSATALLGWPFSVIHVDQPPFELPAKVSGHELVMKGLCTRERQAGHGYHGSRSCFDHV